MSKALYEILEVESDAESSEIKSSYLRLLEENNPDNNSSFEAQEKTREIRHAYSILSEALARFEYDYGYIDDNGKAIEKPELNQLTGSLDSTNSDVSEIRINSNKVSASHVSLDDLLDNFFDDDSDSNSSDEYDELESNSSDEDSQDSVDESLNSLLDEYLNRSSDDKHGKNATDDVVPSQKESELKLPSNMGVYVEDEDFENVPAYHAPVPKIPFEVNVNSNADDEFDDIPAYDAPVPKIPTNKFFGNFVDNYRVQPSIPPKLTLQELSDVVQSACDKYTLCHKWGFNIDKSAVNSNSKSGFFSKIRHWNSGDNAKQFCENINVLGNATVEEAILKLDAYFISENTLYSNHSLSTFLLREFIQCINNKRIFYATQDTYSKENWIELKRYLPLNREQLLLEEFQLI